jgi:hypothetical protein
MKYYLLLLLIHLFLLSQSQETTFTNDTLFLKSGFKVYENLKLKAGTGTMPDGTFKFIRRSSTSLLSYYGVNQSAVNSANALPSRSSGLEYKVIRIDKRGTKRNGFVYYPILGGGVRYEVDIENAVACGEIILPDEYKTKKEATTQLSKADEIKKLKELLDAGAISQEEYDKEKKKILNN